MKKTSKEKKDTKATKSTTALKKGKTAGIKTSAKKRIKDEEEDEDFIPIDDDLTGLELYDDDDDDF
ncbi:MAG: hypothetical protein ACR2GN_09845 [Bacteroidia bacterium]